MNNSSGFQELIQLDVNLLQPNPLQVRNLIKSESLVDLVESIKELETVVAKLELIEQTTRSSHGGKYTAFTIRAMMQSSSEVIAVYKDVSEIEGIVSL